VQHLCAADWGTCPIANRSQVASENRESRAGKAALKAATEPTQPQKFAERGGNLIKVRKS